MAKYYFDGNEEERCYPLDYFIEQLGEGLDEITVYPAVMVTGEGVYYCSELGEVGEVGEGCGKDCSKYQPRNGKNGRCRHSANCYEADYNKPKTLTLLKT